MLNFFMPCFGEYGSRSSDMMGYGASGGMVGGFFMIIWWGAVIVGIILLVRWLMALANKGGVVGKSAVDILKERYAKGEINKEEFEAKKKDLE